MTSPIRAVTLDFYMTLVRPAGGRSRGERFHEYLAGRGMTAAPWEHRVHYLVFPFYLEAYRPSLTPEKKREFWARFAERLFAATGVRGPGADDHASHADAIGRIFGPASFELFDETKPAMAALRNIGLRVAILSNWPPGLAYFCEELGLLRYAEAVIVSSEVGAEKPDRAIFNAAARRLGLAPAEILHAGDTWVDDIEGARGAGFQAALLCREGTERPKEEVLSVRSLMELVEMLKS
jgi:FMN phosphatase YigB (HAD superfamily)